MSNNTENTPTHFTYELQAAPPTECRWTAGTSTPLKNWNEQALRNYAEWMRREIIKAGGFDPQVKPQFDQNNLSDDPGEAGMSLRKAFELAFDPRFYSSENYHKAAFILAKELSKS